MPPAEPTDARLHAHSTSTAPDGSGRPLTVRVSTTVSEQGCPRSGHDTVRTAELLDEHGAPVATINRCDQCTSRRRRGRP